MDTQTMALFLAGVVSPFVTTLIKKIFKDPKGCGALWLAFAISFVLASVVAVVTSISTPPSITDVISFVTWIFDRAVLVFGLSQLIYQNLKGRLML